MRGQQRKHSRGYLAGLTGANDTYTPTGEEQLVLNFMGLELAYNQAVAYMKDVTNGLISRATGIRVIDVGDFQTYIAGRGSNAVAPSSILIIRPNDQDSGFSVKLAFRNNAGDTSGEYVRAKNGYYTPFFFPIGILPKDLYSSTQALAQMLTYDTLNRPAQEYTQQAVSNDNTIGIDKRIADSNALVQAQILADKKAFEENAQIQANIIESQRQKELADEQLRQIQDEIARVTRMQETSDNNADLIYEAQRLEQERQRVARDAAAAQQSINVGTQQGATLARTESTQQQTYNREAELAKLKQIATNTATGAALQKTTQTKAVTTIANAGKPNTAVKPSTSTTTTGTKPNTGAGARTEEPPVDDPSTPEDESKTFPLWGKIAIGVGLVAVAGGTAYYGNKQGWFKDKKGKGKGKGKVKSKSKR